MVEMKNYMVLNYFYTKNHEDQRNGTEVIVKNTKKQTSERLTIRPGKTAGGLCVIPEV